MKMGNRPLHREVPTKTVKQIVEADKEQANRATMEAQFIKDECEEALEMAMPALNDAVSALNTLKPQDISCLSKT